MVVLGETIEAHERIQVEQSLKYSKPGATKLWNTASLKEVDQWMLGEEYGEYTAHLPFYSPTLHSPYPRFHSETFAFPGQPSEGGILRHPTPSENVDPLVIIPHQFQLHH